MESGVNVEVTHPVLCNKSMNGVSECVNSGREFELQSVE